MQSIHFQFAKRVRERASGFLLWHIRLCAYMCVCMFMHSCSNMYVCVSACVLHIGNTVIPLSIFPLHPFFPSLSSHTAASSLQISHGIGAKTPRRRRGDPQGRLPPLREPFESVLHLFSRGHHVRRGARRAIVVVLQ